MRLAGALQLFTVKDVFVTRGVRECLGLKQNRQYCDPCFDNILQFFFFFLQIAFQRLWLNFFNKICLSEMMTDKQIFSPLHQTDYVNNKPCIWEGGH